MASSPFPSIQTVRKKMRRNSLWIFSNEVREVEGEPQQGDVVRVFDRRSYVGNAIYAPGSLIRARLFSRIDRDLDLELLVDRIRTALELRRRELPGEDDFRLVFGESDLLPGLVIDKYGNHFVVQVYAAGLERRLETIIQALRKLFPVQSVYAKNDFRLREIEGLPGYERLLFGELPESVLISEGGVKYYVTIAAGQKSGFYFDQRLTRRRVRELSKDLSVLDAFCYTGGFALNAALGGAREVSAVDTSAGALELLKRNVELNQVGGRVGKTHGDAFTVLRRYNAERRRFDLVVLDPPPFVKRPQEKPQAIKAYRDINYQAMKLLNPGGILVSCSCAHHMFWQDLLDVIAQAGQACGREFRILDRVGQGPDHPVLLSMPETEYLRCYLLQLR